MNSPITLQQLREQVSGQRADAAAPAPAGGTPAWLNALHSTGSEVLAQRAFPQRRDERWRYTPVDRLLAQEFIGATETLPAQHQTAELAALCETPACRLVFDNGRFRPDLSLPVALSGALSGALPAGVTVTGLADAIASMPERVGEWIGQIPADRLHSFSALNSSALHDGLFIHLQAGCVLEQPIEVLHIGGQPASQAASGDAAVLSHTRNLIVLERGAEATLVERYIDATADHPGSYFHNGVTEVQLQADARLQHHRLQQQSQAAWHLDALFVQQQRGSGYRSTLYSLGSRWARNEVNIALRGEGAECELGGAGTVADGQLNDLHLNIEHLAPHCRSDSRWRALLHGKGRGVFDGRILVAQDAQHSDAQLNNANLLLERSAEIDTKPVLEIHADDVRCSHGATVGRLDPQQLFYLRSRGIDATSARRMLALGFAASTLDACLIDALRAEVERDIGERLAADADADADAGNTGA